jgi:sodium/proline symporter
VIMAWSALASAFAPLLIVLCLGRQPSQTISLIAIASGLIVVFVWRLLGWEQFIYEGLAGILTGLAILFLKTDPKPHN